MGTRKFNTGDNRYMDLHPIQLGGSRNITENSCSEYFDLRRLLHYFFTLSKSPIHLSFIRIYLFDTSSLAEWQGTCHAYKNLVYDLAHHESPIAQWLERPTGIWKVMGSTPVGGSEILLRVVLCYRNGER